MAILNNGSQIRQYWSSEVLGNKEQSEGPYNMNIFNSMNINSRLHFEQPVVGGRNFVDCQEIKFACWEECITICGVKNEWKNAVRS